MAISFLLGSAQADRLFGLQLAAVGILLLVGWFAVTSVLRALRPPKPRKR